MVTTPRCVNALRVAWLLGLLLSSVHPQSLNMSTVLITDPTMTRLVALSDRGGKCTYSLDRLYIRQRVLDSPRYLVRQETEAAMDALMDACMDREKFPQFTYSGTKWCGPGNSAESYEDLGTAEAEDRCCRDHDHCPDYLSRGECKNGICNKSWLFYMFHCDCEERFLRCLQAVNTTFAHDIGIIYFPNDVQCFKDRETCPSKDKDGRTRCSEWEFSRIGPYRPGVSICSNTSRISLQPAKLLKRSYD